MIGKVEEGGKTSALAGYQPGRIWLAEPEPAARALAPVSRSRRFWRLLGQFIFDYNRY